jgi:hypothetical protein
MANSADGLDGIRSAGDTGRIGLARPQVDARVGIGGKRHNDGTQMLVFDVGVRCKNPNCEAIPSLGVTTRESNEDLKGWMDAQQPREIECPVCHFVATYSREDLVASLLTK